MALASEGGDVARRIIYKGQGKGFKKPGGILTYVRDLCVGTTLKLIKKPRNSIASVK